MPPPDKEIGHSNNSIIPWSALVDVGERVAELAWPKSIDTYDRMRTDMQIYAVLLTATLPIRRYKWMIDQAGASDEVAEWIANDVALPIKGRDPEPLSRSRDRFSHDFHLRHALLSLTFGSAFFEQVYRYDEDRKKLHIRKLGPRMPKTISAINVETDGGLKSIKQYAAGSPAVGGLVPTFDSPEIPVERLVAYVNDREGGDWRGTSILRPSFR